MFFRSPICSVEQGKMIEREKSVNEYMNVVWAWDGRGDVFLKIFLALITRMSE